MDLRARHAALLLLVAGCGGAQDPPAEEPPVRPRQEARDRPRVRARRPPRKPAETHDGDPIVDPNPLAPSAPAALYAELFVKGNRWKLDVKSKATETPAGKAPKSTKKASVGTCTVMEVVNQPWAITSRIECEEALESEPVSGWYAATAYGLFVLVEPPTPVAQALTKSTLFVKAEGAPSKLEHVDAETGQGQRFNVESKGQAWCRLIWSSSGAEELSSTACVEKGKGFVSGATAHKIKESPEGSSSEEHEIVSKMLTVR